MKRDLVYTTGELPTRPFDATRFLTPSPHQNRCRRPRVEKVGLEQHVNGFASADEAQTWINKKSEGWLRNRTAALRGANHGLARDALASLDRF